MSGTEFGGSWWGKRWVEALERLSTAWQNRLPRGRDYASKGHVISLAVSGGKISAKVQGSRSKPYTTTIEVPTLRDEDWDAVIEQISSQARFPAKLLVGEMPADIEDIFQSVNVTLFPMRNSELLGSCTCPDKARPCKHIAAVHYAFGQALDRDPFLLFQLRGADRMRLQRRLPQGVVRRRARRVGARPQGEHRGARRPSRPCPRTASTARRTRSTACPSRPSGRCNRLILERLSAPRSSWRSRSASSTCSARSTTRLQSSPQRSPPRASTPTCSTPPAAKRTGATPGACSSRSSRRRRRPPAEAPAEEGGYKAFEVPVAAPAEPEDGEEPRALRAAEHARREAEAEGREPAPEPEAPKKSRRRCCAKASPPCRADARTAPARWRW